jgi:hypothetical protein
MKRYFAFVSLFLALAISTSFAQMPAVADTNTHIQSFSLLRAGASVKILWQTATEKTTTTLRSSVVSMARSSASSPWYSPKKMP